MSTCLDDLGEYEVRLFILHLKERPGLGGCLQPHRQQPGAGHAVFLHLTLREQYTECHRLVKVRPPKPREFLMTPALGLRLVNLPGYSPGFNPDEEIWGYTREKATVNLWLGTKALVQMTLISFLTGLSGSKEEVKRRCRTVLQFRAVALMPDCQPNSRRIPIARPTLALV